MKALGTAGALWMLAAVGLPMPVQATRHQVADWSGVSHVIVPQTRAFALGARKDPMAITGIQAHVSLKERTARTTLDIHLRNGGASDSEAVLLLPVPEGAVVSEFLFDGQASEPTAVLLPSAEARETYDGIVRRLKDPALLEFAGYNLIRSSVFPVPAGGTQHLRIRYDHILAVQGDRVDYVLPRSESLAAQVPWSIEVEIDEARPVTVAYSPSHAVERSRLDKAGKRLLLRVPQTTEPGAFRLSYLLEGVGISASFLAYPDVSIGGGYFLLMAGLPIRESEQRKIPRELTFVLDRSGSMAGEKLEQSLAAVRQVIEGLEEHERFNIVDYAGQVATFAPGPVPRSRENLLTARQYLRGLRPGGGTNIHDALQWTLNQKATEGYLPIVLFLTDGLPTVGPTGEVTIREMVKANNKAQRRVFTLGVGADVNVPLLDYISDESRAMGSYVSPGEDVEAKVARVFERLSGPVLSDLNLEVRDAAGVLSTRALHQMLPAQLPDVFRGEQIVLLGQYRGEGLLNFRLSGQDGDRRRSFAFQFELGNSDPANSFVARLWAARKIAELTDEIRQAGAANSAHAGVGIDPFDDPRYREMAEEILRLSTRHGILSEYTSFLAREGTRLDDWHRLSISCRDQLDRWAVKSRVGESALYQGVNFNARKVQSVANVSNAFLNESGEVESFTTVQQICDRAFYRQGNRWVDSNLIAAGADQKVAEVHLFGSEAHGAVLRELQRDGRQGLLSLPGEILLRHGGKNILIKNTSN